MRLAELGASVRAAQIGAPAASQRISRKSSLHSLPLAAKCAPNSRGPSSSGLEMRADDKSNKLKLARNPLGALAKIGSLDCVLTIQLTCLAARRVGAE